MSRVVVLAALAVASDAFMPALVPGAPKLRAQQRSALSMRIEPGQKILIEIPSAANVHVVAAVQEVVEEDASASAAAAKAGSGITINTAGMGQAPFWVAFIGGLTVLKMIRQKAAGRGILDNKDAKYIPQSEEELKDLKIFACGGCGYEMMPARGREGKFFPKDFKCPICGADKDQFWDMNDPNDPRNQEEEEPKKPAAKSSAAPKKEPDTKTADEDKKEDK